MNKKERTKMVKWARDLRDAVNPNPFVVMSRGAILRIERIWMEMLKEVREWSAKHVEKR